MNAIKIAELAGVSKSTVYRALNGEKIKDSTKKRIMAVMKENNISESFSSLGFTPQSVKLVALVTDKKERKQLSAVIENIKDKFVSNGFTIIDVSAETIAANRSEAEKVTKEINFHGYVFIGQDVCSKCSAVIKSASAKKPVILVHAEMEGKNIYSVSTDSESVTISTVSNLINKFGHKKFLYCTSNDTFYSPYGKKLVEDFESAVRLTGCSDVSCSFIRSGTSQLDTTAFISDYIRNDSSVTAIVAQDESAAECALRAVEQLGLSVPEDISVVGYQNTDSAAEVIKNVSCINSKSDNVADMALMLMIAALNGRHVPHSIKIPCTYSERHSTAVANNRTESYISAAVIGSFVSA